MTATGAETPTLGAGAESVATLQSRYVPGRISVVSQGLAIAGLAALQAAVPSRREFVVGGDPASLLLSVTVTVPRTHGAPFGNATTGGLAVGGVVSGGGEMVTELPLLYTGAVGGEVVDLHVVAPGAVGRRIGRARVRRTDGRGRSGDRTRSDRRDGAARPRSPVELLRADIESPSSS